VIDFQSYLPCNLGVTVWQAAALVRKHRRMQRLPRRPDGPARYIAARDAQNVATVPLCTRAREDVLDVLEVEERIVESSAKPMHVVDCECLR